MAHLTEPLGHDPLDNWHPADPLDTTPWTQPLGHRAVLEQHPPFAVLLVALPLAAVARA